MTDTIHEPGQTSTEATPAPRAVAPSRDRVGPLGYGNGPALAAGIMVGGAVLFAGWGMTQILAADESTASETPAVATRTPNPGEEGTGTVTLPDLDRNGIPTPSRTSAGTAPPGKGPSPSGQGDKDWAGKTPSVPEPTRETKVYIIKPGDTLTEISGETGVPIGVLIEKNRIQNPNLIYAGASLLIPLVG